MQALSPCPTNQDYQRVMLGELSPSDVEYVADHLERCGRCIETVQTLKAEDTLLEIVREARTAVIEKPPDNVVQDLLSKLRQAPTPSPSPQADRYATFEPELRQPPGSTDRQRYDFLAPPEQPDEIGRLGNYRIFRVLGAGGMGVVFHAEDLQLKRPVALKAMKSELALSPSARSRFLREAQAVAAIEHDHIVAIHQVGEDRGVPFLAMQFLHGETLEERLRRDGKLPVSEALRIGREIALGLAAAHERGLVHRDIKPSNIWLETRRPETRSVIRVKVLDFGLARAIDDDVRLTPTGAVVGTPAYMAPEQASGEAIDLRCDLFSLGCVLYHTCTGEVPFQRPTTMATLLALAKHQPQAPHEINPNVPPPVSNLVMKLLAKNPDDRPPSAVAVVKAIEAIEATGHEQQGKGSEEADNLSKATPLMPPTAFPSPLSPAPGPLSAARRRPWRPVAVAAVVLALIGGGFLAPQIIIRLKSNDGRVIEIKSAPGDEVEVEKDGKVLKVSGDREKLQPSPKAGPVLVRPEPIAVPDGAPLSAMALVGRPAQIKGLQSWTMETRGHRSAIYGLAYSPDGRWLATAGEDGTIRLWEVDTGRLVRALVGHASVIRAVAWSPDGKTLASASLDQTVRLWDAASGRPLRILRGHPRDVNAVAWSPDSKTLASASFRELRLWDAASGETLHTLQGHTEHICGLAYSPDGKTLASGDSDKTVRLWDADAGQLLRTLEGHTAPVDSVAFSPDGKTLASAGQDRIVRLWEAGSGRPLHTLQGHEAPITALAWSPDGKTLASGGLHDKVRLWVAESGKARGSLYAGAHAIAWSPDGKTVVTGDHVGTVRFWEADSGELRRTISGHQGHFERPAWSPDAKTLAIGLGDHPGVQLWHLDSGQRRTTLQETRICGAVAWSPEGKTLAACNNPDRVNLCDTASGETLHTLQGHTEAAGFVVFSPDGKSLAAGSFDKTVRVWEVKTGKLLHTLHGHTSAVLVVAWSPDGKTLASGTGGQDTTVRLWDAASAKNLHTLQGPTGTVCAVAWSPDGKTLASGDNDGTVRFWDVESGRLLESLESSQGHTGAVWSLAWLPDGKTLASSSYDQTLRFWDTTDGHLVRTIPLGAFGTFSPDGRMLASTGPRMAKLWEVETGRPRGTLVMLRNDQYLVITADGQFRGSPRVEREMVYVIQTERSQETLTPEEFAARFSWKNDPERVLLIATPTKPPSEIVASPAGSLVGPERRAAEWVLSLGGSLRIRRGDAEREIVAANDLPAGELQVVSVGLIHHRVTDADLEHLKALPRLRRLYLGNYGGSGAGLENLKVLPNLTSLTLIGTRVSDAGLEHLKALPNLTELHLGGSGMTDADLDHLKALPGITGLWLDEAHVSDAGLQHLKALPRLSQLRLNRTAVSDAGLKHLQALPNLTNLNLGATRVSGAGLEHLKALPNLHSLFLSGTRVSDAGLEHLKALPKLGELILGNSQVSDAGVEHLKALPNLLHLDLGATRVSDAGLKHLMALPNLTQLHLYGTRVSDAGLKYLARLPAIRNLDLVKTRVSALGFATLKTARPDVKIDWSEPNRTAAEAVLALGGTVRLRPDGAEADLQAKAAADLPLQYFRVVAVSLAEVPNDIGDALPKLAALTDHDFDGLQTLDLAGTKVNDAGLEHLKGLSGLRRLILDRCPVRGSGLTHLKDLAELTELGLGCPSLTDLFVHDVAELKHVEQLSLATSSVTNEGLKELYGLTNLQKLDLTSTKVTADGVAALQKALPNCKIVREPPAGSPTKQVADKPKPFVLVRSNGAKREEFASIAQALGEHKNGDTIEVHGNGPFRVGPVLLKEKDLILRAGSGYRPRFIPADAAAEKTWFDIQGGEVTIEGCHFQLRSEIWTPLFLSYSGPSLRVADCLMWNPSNGRGAHSLIRVGAGSHINLTNNIVLNQEGSMMDLAEPGGQVIRLNHNTLHLAYRLIYCSGEKSFQPSTVHARSNIFEVGYPHSLYGPEWKGRLHWRGWQNLYVSQNTLTAQSGEKEVVKGLDAWSKYWGNQEEGSKETNKVLFGWDKLEAQPPDATIEEFKRLTQGVRQTYRLPNLGPDWDLVGPGEAYVRAWKAEGRAVLNEHLRAPQPADGPFVLLREGRAIRGCETLWDAVRAAASGDTIEIRSDDKFVIGNYGSSPAGNLTLRAGLGYRPILQDGMASGIDWAAVEGIHFRGAHLHGRIGRLVNCSFDKIPDQGFRRWYPRIRSTSEGKLTEIVNCLIPSYAAEVRLAPRTKLIIRNSLIGEVRLAVPNQGDPEVKMEHCFVSSGLGPAFWVDGSLAISSRDTMFTCECLVVHDGDLPWRWHGSANAYRIGPRPWRIFCVPSDKTFAGLELWRKHWKSDANSVEMAPLDLDPLQWRLLPSSPGYRASPDGKDTGADVDRIAGTANAAKKSE